MSSTMKFINLPFLLCFFLCILISRTLSDFTSDGGADTLHDNDNDDDDSPELEVPRSPKINGPSHEHIRVPVGSNIQNLTCEYYGIPTPKVVWAKDASEVPAHFKVENFPESGKSVLVFPITAAAQNETELAGNYTCAAANFVSRTQKVFEVSFGPPEENLLTTTVTYDQEESTQADVGGEEEEEVTVEDATTAYLDTTTQLPSVINILSKT